MHVVKANVVYFGKELFSVFISPSSICLLLRCLYFYFLVFYLLWLIYLLLSHSFSFISIYYNMSTVEYCSNQNHEIILEYKCVISVQVLCSADNTTNYIEACPTLAGSPQKCQQQTFRTGPNATPCVIQCHIEVGISSIYNSVKLIRPVLVDILFQHLSVLQIR